MIQVFSNMKHPAGLRGIILQQNQRAAKMKKNCNVLELVDNFGFLISFFIDKFIC
ncbi:hypothetical protein GCWU000325_01640 [Alloprevotella tannerae ATCC 51259]|uniref:Uncharacterized protein n=1 Tax=Alloprevotella tannerae ATCC 51259 TaxID=626522 RepID=C9LHD7_9BACT|nr:hypothetical protein GCWU000325_01640 [Alloprevotella tannerae ATCC 51259]